MTASYMEQSSRDKIGHIYALNLPYEQSLEIRIHPFSETGKEGS